MSLQFAPQTFATQSRQWKLKGRDFAGSYQVPGQQNAVQSGSATLVSSGPGRVHLIDEVYDISSSDLVFRIACFIGFLKSVAVGAAIAAGPVALALFVPLVFIAIIVSPFYYSRRRRKGLQTVDVNLGSVSSILIDTENERFAFRVGGTDLTWRSFAVTEDFASAVTHLKQIHGPQISGGTITGGNKVPVIIMLVLVGAMIIGLSIAAINIFWPFLLR